MQTAFSLVTTATLAASAGFTGTVIVSAIYTITLSAVTISAFTIIHNSKVYSLYSIE